MPANAPKVLILEDEQGLQDMYQETLDEKVTILAAVRTEEGRRLLEAHPDTALVVMDGQVPGIPDTPSLVREIRKTFPGPIIASSSRPDLQEKLMAAGCTHESEKREVPQLVLQLLNL